MKIFGIDNNFDVGAKEPVVYTMCDSALVNRGKPFFLPDYAQPCLCQAHMVVRISHMGRSISERFAHRYYDAISVGVDFTAQQLLEKLKANSLPWDLAKGFDGSAVIGNFVSVGGVIAPHNIELDINGNVVQQFNTSALAHGADALVAYISSFVSLKTGDLIYTGSPLSEVTVKENDHIDGLLDGEKVLSFNVR